MLKKLFLVAGILTFLGSGVWLWNTRSSLHAVISQSPGTAAESSTILSQLDSEKLTSIEIRNHDDTVALHKDATEQWHVTSFNHVANTDKSHAP